MNKKRIDRIRYGALILIIGIITACATNSGAGLYQEGYYLASINQLVGEWEKSGRSPSNQEITMVSDSLRHLESNLAASEGDNARKVAALKEIATAKTRLSDGGYSRHFSDFINSPLYQASTLNQAIVDAYYAWGMSREIKNPTDQRWRVAIFKEGLAYGDHPKMRAQLAKSESSYRQAVKRHQIPGKIRVAIRYQSNGNYADQLTPAIRSSIEGIFSDKKYQLSQDIPFGEVDINLDLNYNVNARARRAPEHRYYIGNGRYDDSTPFYELYGEIRGEIYLVVTTPFSATYRDEITLSAKGQDYFYTAAYRERLFKRLDETIVSQIDGGIYRLLPYIESANRELEQNEPRY